MYIITLKVNAPPGNPLGIKEAIATDMEKYGDTKVVSVKEVQPEQMKLEV